MAIAASARRYAQAAFEIARDQNAFDRWRTDMAKLAALAQDPGFQMIMDSPRVHLDQKTAILQESLTDVDPLVLNLARLLVQKRRAELIPGLLEEFNRLVDQHNGIEHARVTTAVPLNAAAQGTLTSQLSQLTGKQVVVTVDVDPAIMGGLVARIGDKLIDGSTRGRLQTLRQELTRAR